MQVNPVSSISYRVAQSKRSSVGETESERRLYTAHQAIHRPEPYHDTEDAVRSSSRSVALSVINTQLGASGQFQREMALNMGYVLYQRAAVRQQASQFKTVISLTV